VGRLGVYMMVEAGTLEELQELDDDDLLEELEALEDETEIYSIDKFWAGLHFLLTGVSDESPVKDNKLSQAVLGSTPFENIEDFYVALLKKDELPETLKALEAVDLKGLEASFDPGIFAKLKIYPDIWQKTEKVKLFDMLSHEYQGLLEFYKKAQQKQANVVFSVY
jgi:hypothetical protein